MVFAYLWIFLLTQISETSARAGTACMFNDQRYEIGDTWHPILEPFSKPCINCTCQPNGKVKCTPPPCPRPKCKVPVTVPGECCPTCDLQTNGEEGSATPSPGCEFNGEVYEDGAMFSSEHTGVKPTRDDQCVMCVCLAGKVLCHLKTCADHGKCSKYTNVSDDCCPQCEEEPAYTDYLDIILSGERPENTSKSDCATAIGTKRNGETWHPLISVYGPNKCILCKCLEGRVTCSRKKCAPHEKLPCRKPVRVEGECCLTCPKQDRKRDCKRRRGKDGKKRKRCKKNGGKLRKKSRKNKPKNGTNTVLTTTSLPVTSPLPSLFPTMCLPKRGDRYVYQIEDKHSLVLVFDVPTADTVEMLKWTLRKGKLSEMVKEERPASETRGTIQRSHVLGATNKRNFKKFKRKLRKKLQRCKTPCRRKVITSCLKRLKVKNVKFGKQCDKH